MSRSNLYRLFEETGGVAQYIQRQRLLAAHIALAHSANTTPISVLAEDFCFADASSFSRVFKWEFGNSPNEVRTAAIGGVLPAGAPPPRALSERKDFSGLLHGF